jgi:hypothetical protein
MILHHRRRALLAADHRRVDAAGLGSLGGEVQPRPAAAITRQPCVQAGRLIELRVGEAIGQHFEMVPFLSVPAFI